MKFGEFPVYDALGLELVHDISCHRHLLKKGRVLTSGDLDILRQHGVKTVLGLQYTSDDVLAEVASDVLLKTLSGDNITYTLPDEKGYSELYAQTDGVLVFDKERLNRFNAHCETVCFVGVEPYTPVYKGQFLGNLHFFEPSILADTLGELVTKISGVGPLIKVAHYAFCKMGFIETTLDKEDVSPLDKDEIQARFNMYGFNIASCEKCFHSSEEVENAVRNAFDLGVDVILVESPLRTLNRNDIVPKGLIEASCEIDRLHLPLEKGLSVALAHRKETQIIGYCKDDIEEPSFDRLIRFLATKSLPEENVLTSLASNGISFARMVKRITPEQEENAVKVGLLSESEKLGVVILAAGNSRRMMGSTKLLEAVNGLPMIDRVVRAALTSKAQYVVVVTGHHAKHIERRLAQYDVKIVRNPDYVSGVLGSMRLGLSVLPPDIVGALVLPADMPAFTEEYIDSMIDLFDLKDKAKQVIVPSYNGVRYNPVLWSRDLFKDVKIIPEDSHWTPALIEHSDYIKELELKDDLPVTDINTQGDLSDYHNRLGLVSQAENDLFALEKKH